MADKYRPPEVLYTAIAGLVKAVEAWAVLPDTFSSDVHAHGELNGACS
jgi:hypothetical protein